MPESKAVNGAIAITDSGGMVKNMKNNKAPGIDGFPADFLRVFGKI